MVSLPRALLRGKDAVPKSPDPLPHPSFGRKFSWISPPSLLGSLDPSELATFPWDCQDSHLRAAWMRMDQLQNAPSVIFQAPVEFRSLSWIPGGPHTTHMQHPRISASLCLWEFREKMDFFPSVAISCMFTELLSWLEGIY